MQILVFSPVWTHPHDDGSRLRVYNLTKHLKMMGHTIHFVYYVDNETEINKKSFLAMEREWDTLTVINREVTIKRRTGNYEIDEWYEESIHEKVNELVELFNINIVWTNYITHSKFLEYLPDNIFKVIDTHDALSDRYKLFSDKQGVTYSWYSFFKEDEAKVLNRANLIVAITEEEKKYFSQITNKDISVIGHFEPKHYTNRKFHSLSKLGFIGGANQVNVIAINDFLDLYFKKSKNQDQLKIVIAGKICKTIKIKNKNLTLMGYIDNVEAFYSEVNLIINPLTFGTGQKIKSVEALSYGVPIISTRVGFEGIKSSSKYHQIETIDQMVEAIDDIFTKPEVLNHLTEISKTTFDNYKTKLDEKIADIFELHKLTPGIQKSSTCNEQSALLTKYKQQSQKESDALIIQHQGQMLKKKEQQIQKQSKWTKEQEQIIKKKDKEITYLNEKLRVQEKEVKLTKSYLQAILDEIHQLVTTSGKTELLKKYKAYKEMLKTYYKIKKREIN